MKTFRFYQDIKITLWERQHFEIEAENETEAKRIAMRFQDTDVSDYDEYNRSEKLFDTEENMTVEENGGYDTIQLYLRGEKHPFATNGNEKIKRMIASFDQFKTAHEVAYGIMAGHTIEATDTYGSFHFHAFHSKDNLNIIMMDDDDTVKRYTFNESWNSLVNENEEFRQSMSDYLLKKSADVESSSAEIHDWLEGHLTEMTATSDAVDNQVPFGLFELIYVWGKKADVVTVLPAALIGYQVVGDNDKYPEKLDSSRIIRDRQQALDILEKSRLAEPDANYNIYPVYENEIPDVSFV